MSPAVIAFLPLLYILLQWAALARMRAGWRIAALLPVIMMGFALLATAVGIAANASLVPVALVAGLPIATLYLMLLWPLWLALRGSTR